MRRYRPPSAARRARPRFRPHVRPASSRGSARCPCRATAARRAPAARPCILSRAPAPARASARSRFFWKFSPWKRGFLRRQSSGARSAGDLIWPVRKPRPSGTVGDERDAQLADGAEQLVLRVAAPERVLGLQRGDRMDRVRAADGLRRRLGQAEVAHLARLSRDRPSRPTVSSIGVSDRPGAGSRRRSCRRPAAAARRRTPGARTRAGR